MSAANFNVSSGGGNTLREWFFYQLEALDMVVFAKVCVLIWCLWKQRNLCLWEGQLQQPAQTVFCALSFLCDWASACSLQRNGNEARVMLEVLTCCPPQPGFVKCNVDGAVFTASGRSGFGMVIRDSAGSFVMGADGSSPGLFNVKLAEAIGLREAVQWVLSLGRSNVIFEYDAKVVVDAVLSGAADLFEFGAVIADCRLLLQHGCNYSVQFIRKQANLVAHSLARASHLQDGFNMFSVPPDCIRNLVPPFVPFAG
eukprot:XP_025015232.1 uncharacterized protein LOC112536661 [Ricinus communis]